MALVRKLDPTAIFRDENWTLWLMLRFGLQNIEHFRLICTISFRRLRAIVFDQMIPKIARYY